MMTQFLTISIVLFYVILPTYSQEFAANQGLFEITKSIRQQVPLEEKVLGLQGEDGEVYFRVLRKLLELPGGELDAGARKFLSSRFPKINRQDLPRDLPVYADMHFHMREYHGQPVILHGHTQRIMPLDIDPPVNGITKLYEIWLFTGDSQNNPTVIISPGLPQQFKLGDEIQNHLQVTGVLFKKYYYQAQDQVRFAPLILAGELSYDPPTYKSIYEQQGYLLIASLFVVLFGVIMYVIVIKQKTNKNSQRLDDLPEQLELNTEDVEKKS